MQYAEALRLISHRSMPVGEFLEKNEPVRAKTQGRCLVVVGCRQVLPPELERKGVGPII